jgi:UPF0042 nucleotide-binding protein
VNIIIITGISGSGKSSVLNYLEDKGFYCVDNLPLLLIDKFIEILNNSSYENVAIGIDIREYLISEDFKKFKEIKDRIEDIFILFLDTTTKELYKRYNESRRKHPLKEANLEKAIEKEKQILAPIKDDSDYFLDTTNLSIKNLYKELDDIFKLKKDESNFFINITSFGFKYGNFNNSHLMFDVRFLPNPFFIESLKHQTGLEAAVYNYVINHEETKEFIKKLDDMIDYLIPLYEREGRHYLNIAIGCTGGKHRSVSIARYIHNKLLNNYNVTIVHREVEGE